MRIAAIDQGTTSTRALVVEADGSAAISHSVSHRQIYPSSGWVEHDPCELLDNVRACIASVGAVDALGVANQGESCLAWDATTRTPLSPVIVWQDNRTAARTAQLKDAGVERLTLSRAGLPLDPYFSASKLAWLIENVPAVRSAHAAGRLRLGTTDAFFLDSLTGVFATDASTASRTSLMNLATGQWDAELCDAFGVPRESLPEIRATVSGFGVVGGIPIVASVVDQQAALFGHGCRRPGDAKITFGTGAFALAVTGDAIVRAPNEGLLSTVAWRIGDHTTFAIDGGVYDAGAAVDWARRIGLIDDLSELDSFDAAPAIERGLTFVPALSGLACPHWDRSAAALWIGMSTATTRRDMQQALLEGVALRTAEVVAAMHTHAPLGDRISIDGGLTRSAYFNQFLANALDRSVVTRSFDELTALGCAGLAASARGARPDWKGTAQRVIQPNAGDRRPWRLRFSGAVQRASGWRRSDGG